MRKNKGFSLVELIIVIAIMAILIGVMAPQLIKYIEKSKVSSDTQLAGTVQTAIVTALSDPEVNDWSLYDSTFTEWEKAQGVASLATGNKLESAALETLGAKSGGEVDGSLKSSKASKVSFRVVDANSVSVWIPGSDASGSKGKNNATCSIISVD